MSALSPHLKEQKFGRRTVCYSLRDAKVVAPPSTTENTSMLTLRTSDGSVEYIKTEGWNISLAEGDIITQVLLTPLKGKRSVLASVINRNQRERQQVAPLGTLLHKARVSRAFGWWLSVFFLVSAAVVTETGLFAQKISIFLNSLRSYLPEVTLPYFDFVFRVFEGALGWLSEKVVPVWSSQTSASFGSLQDHRSILLLAIFFMVLILWSRTLRFISVPLFAVCFFLLKIRVFGFDSAHNAVFSWYLPILSLLVLFGATNALRDRWRITARLLAICKSQISQPLPLGMRDVVTSPDAEINQEKPDSAMA